MTSLIDLRAPMDVVVAHEDYYPSLYRSEIEDSEDFLVTVRSSLVLQQEGLVNDLVFHVNNHRKLNGYAVTDNIHLDLGVSKEVWWSIHFNMDLFASKTKVSSVSYNSVPLSEMIKSWDKVLVGDKRSGTSPVYLSSYVV